MQYIFQNLARKKTVGKYILRKRVPEAQEIHENKLVENFVHVILLQFK